MPVLWPHPPLPYSGALYPYNYEKYYIDTIVRYSFRRSYLFHGAIEDCASDEIIMRHDIHKDMNISYYAYMDSNLAMILDAPR